MTLPGLTRSDRTSCGLPAGPDHACASPSEKNSRRLDPRSSALTPRTSGLRRRGRCVSMLSSGAGPERIAADAGVGLVARGHGGWLSRTIIRIGLPGRDRVARWPGSSCGRTTESPNRATARSAIPARRQAVGDADRRADRVLRVEPVGHRHQAARVADEDQGLPSAPRRPRERIQDLAYRHPAQ